MKQKLRSHSLARIYYRKGEPLKTPATGVFKAALPLVSIPQDLSTPLVTRCDPGGVVRICDFNVEQTQAAKQHHKYLLFY